MTADRSTPEVADFLSRFFGPGNRLRWDAYCNGQMAANVRDLLTPLVEDLVTGDVPAILPRVSEAGTNAIQWYALACDAKQARATREQLQSFVGPTYTDFTGQLASLDLSDPIEAAIADRFAPHVFRLRVVNHNDRDKVRTQITRLRALRETHPDRATRLLRPVGRLLRDLEMALVVGHEESAWQCLDDLRARGRLSAHNLSFLKVRVLAAFGKWEELRSLPEITSLYTIRRPVRVTEALIHGLYAEHFHQFEENGDVAGCISRFREIEPNLGTLFRSRGTLGDSTVVKAFLIRSVATQEADAARTLIHELPATHPSRAWAESLVRSLHAAPSATPEDTTAPPTSFERARSACDSGDFDTAFESLLECAASVEVIRQLVSCALELDSLEAARQAVNYVESSPPDVRDAALSMRTFARSWHELREQTASSAEDDVPLAIPDSWNAWLRQLNERGPWPAGIETAHKGRQEWRTDDYRASSESITELADLLVASRPPQAEVALRSIAPDLLSFFLPDGECIREFKPVYTSLIWLLALDDAIGADDLTALESLAEAVLEAGLRATPEANEYTDLLDALEAAWHHVRSFHHLDWAMSVLDLLIAFNVPQHAPVDQFLHNILDGFRNWSRRIGNDQWELIDMLAADLGHGDLLRALRPEGSRAADDTSLRKDQLIGKTVAIYTLTERIGRRAAQLIERTFDSVNVQLLHDKVASDRLKQLANTADIFVVNTWDAKHAATTSIARERHRDPPPLYPISKSSRSILHSLCTYLDG